MMAVVRCEVDLGSFSLRPLEFVGEPLDGPRVLDAVLAVVDNVLAGSRIDSQPHSSTPPGVAAGYTVFLSSALVPAHFPEVNELGLELDAPHPLIRCFAVRSLGSEKSHMGCMSNKPPHNGVVQRDLGLEELLERPLHGLDLALDDARCPFGGTISLWIMRRRFFCNC